MELSIVIPSMSRAGRVTTLRHVPAAVLCVPDSQVADYRSCHPDADILGHPDTVAGLAAKRDWIYRRFGDVFMLDDDIVTVMDWTAAPGESSILRPPRPELIIRQAADLARQLGVFLFGFPNLTGPMGYTEHRPFSLTSFVPGNAAGVLAGSKLFWRPDIRSVDDVWLYLLNAHYHRMTLLDVRYTFKHQATFKNPGGLATTRNRVSMHLEFDRIIEAFGPAIERQENRKGGQFHDSFPVYHLPWE